MSLIVLAAAMAASAASAAVLAMRRIAKRDREEEEEQKKAGPPPPPIKPAVDAEGVLASLPVGIGDVVSVDDDPTSASSKTMRERWLVGGLCLWDAESLVGAVFVAPEGSRDEAVAGFAAPRREIAWMSPEAVELGAEPPSALELGGVVMQRRRRLFVRLERLGKGAPDVGERGVFAEYAASGRAVAIVIRGDRATVAWSGVRFDPGEYDRMGRGG